MNRLIIVVFSLFLVTCSIDRTIAELSEAEISIHSDYQNLPSENKLKIANKNEPGEKLILCLTFIDKETKKALSHQQVKFYHTSANGNYEQSDTIL
ncbi:hypothetical protein [Winogradskyella sp. A3E31]|uniref:hypothetical protein n=1 Tax=Winogradskyella sp. A3E31 TaxID=3349637 RepID=UPI00398B06E8